MNLGSGDERGPYLVTQTGVAPGDPLLKTHMFVLRPDGHWVDFNAYACRGKPEAMDEIVFPSVTTILQRFETLFGVPRVVELPVDKAGLEAWLKHYSNNPLEGLRDWLKDYKVRHRKDHGW